MTKAYLSSIVNVIVNVMTTVYGKLDNRNVNLLLVDKLPDILMSDNNKI